MRGLPVRRIDRDLWRIDTNPLAFIGNADVIARLITTV